MGSFIDIVCGEKSGGALAQWLERELQIIRPSRLTQSTVCENPQLKPKQPKAMRWLSHDKACDTLRQILPSVIVSLEREAQEKGDSLALGLAKNVQTLQFVATLYTMCDILPQLSILSKCFQESSLELTDIQDHIKMTLDILDARLSSPGKHYRQIVETVATLENNHFRISRQGIYDFDTFKQKVHDKFLLHLCQNIRDRFPDMGVITAFSCLDPSGMRNISIHDLDGIDDDKMETLCEHYDGEIDPTATMQEFSSFKLYLHKYKEKKFDTILSSSLGTSLKSLYPNLARLAEICLVIPASIADCERGFSAMKRVKTDLRNRLSQKILNALMMVSVQGPPPKEFNFQRAVEKWGSMRRRKLDLGIRDEISEVEESDQRRFEFVDDCDLFMIIM
ncbi:hypothetical protein ScPMuIL_001177 [Solemya velum]